MRATSLPDDAEYQELLPHFSGVLARLSAQGMLSSAATGLDLIHDFFLAEWSQVQRAHRAERGPLAPYAAVAFRRFVLRQLARDGRRRALLQSFTPSDVPAEADTIEPADLARLSHALQSMPQEERSLLLEWGGGEAGSSERALARAHRTTRYRIRQRLMAALTRLAEALDEPGQLTPFDLLVMRGLLVSGESEPGLADRLGVPVTRIRAARRRASIALAAALT